MKNIRESQTRYNILDNLLLVWNLVTNTTDSGIDILTELLSILG